MKIFGKSKEELSTIFLSMIKNFIGDIIITKKKIKKIDKYI